jgi:hypothetical protein
MAQSGHSTAIAQCPLSGVEQPRLWLDCVAANDPKRTFAGRSISACSLTPKKADNLIVPVIRGDIMKIGF